MVDALGFVDRARVEVMDGLGGLPDWDGTLFNGFGDSWNYVQV